MEITSLVPIRERLGKPSAREVQLYTSTFTPIVHSYPNRIEGKVAKNTYLALGSLKRHYENHGLSIPRSMLCAVVLDGQQLQTYLGYAKEGLDKGDLPHFRFLFDFAWGASHIWRGIQEAVDEVDSSEEESDQSVDKISKETQAIFGLEAPDIAITEGVGLRMRRLLEARVLIEEDPRGFRFADTAVARFKEAPEEFLLSSQEKEYALLGTEVATAMYKKVYDIAAPLYSPTQSS